MYEDKTDPFNEGLTFTGDARSFLMQIAKWSRFLSIVGFVGLGLMLIMALFMGTIMANIPMAASPYGDGVPAGMALSGGIFTVIYILIVLLYFFPIWYLFKFSRRAIAALDNNDSHGIAEALEYLKSHYKFLGIFTLIILGIYALFFIGTMIFGAIAAASM